MFFYICEIRVNVYCQPLLTCDEGRVYSCFFIRQETQTMIYQESSPQA